MAGFLLVFAVLCAVTVLAGEMIEMAWKRRLADAGRPRMQAPARPRLR